MTTDQAPEPSQERLDALQEEIDKARGDAAGLEVEEEPRFIRSGEQSGEDSGDPEDRPVDDTIAPPG